jgi:hypothetical protein
MTKIYIYCLFDRWDVFYGVYSSLKAAHRDALKVANVGTAAVFMETEHGPQKPSLTLLRNTFKGRHDVWVKYSGGTNNAKILKTKLKE